MKKYGYVVLAAIAAVLVSLSLSSSAQAYPDARVDLTVNHQVVSSGDAFTVTGTSTVPCVMDVEWNHVVKHSAATTKFVARYVAPQVSKATTLPVTAVCRLVDVGAGKAAPEVTTLQRELDVTVLPASNAAPAPTDQSADLPGTGGPNWLVLLSGLVLALVGASAVALARRGADEVELPGHTA